MTISRLINFICIVAGGLVALYAQAQAQQNIYVNQVGYKTNAPKHFYTDYSADSFAVIQMPDLGDKDLSHPA